MNHLLARAVFAFLVLPGVVAFYVPLALLRPEGAAFDALGLAPLIAGSVLLLWCVRDFYVSGKGTLAPWSPPTRLVTLGLYRFSRNPMYLSVATILIGWAVAFHSRDLWIYAAIVVVFFHARVILFEEPYLLRTFHDEWMQYRAQVPRWIGRRRGARALHQHVTR